MLPVIYTLDQERSLKLGFRGIAKLEKVFSENVDKWNLKELDNGIGPGCGRGDSSYRPP